MVQKGLKLSETYLVYVAFLPPGYKISLLDKDILYNQHLKKLISISWKAGSKTLFWQNLVNCYHSILQYKCLI